MPRIARVVATGMPHHVTQRGNYRQDVFTDASDRLQYLAWIKEYSLKYGLSILAYCLMQNHVHFIAIPLRNDSLARTFNAAHMRYSQYFNRKLEQRGHLWQGRFYSCILDEPHLLLAARYVERNPVRAKLVEKPWHWPWSSARTHAGQSEDCFFELGDLLSIIDMSHDSWGRYLEVVDEMSFVQDIRKYTLTGRPLGRGVFIKGLEEKFHRKLSALPIGRPAKG